MKNSFDQPIIVVGTGRCGSTIFFEALSHHHELGWMTRYDASLPESKLAQLHHYVRRSDLLNRWLVTEKIQNAAKPGLFGKYLIRPVEGYAKWKLLCGHEFGKEYLVDRQAGPEAAARIVQFFQTLLQRQGKSRLVIKVTGPTRIHFLNSVFPDAKFVHVVRDPCAVANSLMRTRFWQSSLDQPRWQNGLPANWESEWEKYGRSPLALIAIQYRAIMNICDQEVAEIDSSRYLKLTYREFVESPTQTMDAVLKWANLGPSPSVTAYVGTPDRYRNMNHKYHEHLSANEIGMIREITSQQYGEISNAN